MGAFSPSNTDVKSSTVRGGDLADTHQVTGSLNITGSITLNGSPLAPGGSPGGATTQVQYNNAGAFAGDADFVFDSAQSRVGIGTDSPAHALHVANAGPTALFLEADTDNLDESDTSYIKMTQDGGNTGAIFGLCPNDATKDPAGNAYTGAVGSGFLFGTTTSTPIQLGTNDAVRMTIKQAGNVGIGITNPTQLLDVAGIANATTLAIGGVSITSTAAELNLLDASTATPAAASWAAVERVGVFSIAGAYAGSAIAGGGTDHILGTLPAGAFITDAFLDVTVVFNPASANVAIALGTATTYTFASNPILAQAQPSSIPRTGGAIDATSTTGVISIPNGSGLGVQYPGDKLPAQENVLLNVADGAGGTDGLTGVTAKLYIKYIVM